MSGLNNPSKIPLFIWELWRLVNNSQHQDWISWNTSGDAFVIKDFNKFATPCVMKNHSYVQLLTLYGFKKKSELNEYYHLSFRRGRPDLLIEIKPEENNPSKTQNTFISLHQISQKKSLRRATSNLLATQQEGECTEQQPMSADSSGLFVKIPVFLRELWDTLEKPDMQHLLSWSESGDAIVIKDMHLFEAQYPTKTNRSSSTFIRILNMYGFQKKKDLGERTNRREYYNPFFKRDHPDRLVHIKSRRHKNYSSHQLVEYKQNKNILSRIVKKMCHRQIKTKRKLQSIQQENGAIWKELATLKLKQTKQTQMMKKTVQFIDSLMQPSAS